MNTKMYFSNDTSSMTEWNKEKHLMTIKGRMLSLTPSDVWNNLNNWLVNLETSPVKSKTTIEIQLDYINTMNLIALCSFVKKVSALSIEEKLFDIRWKYENGDEDMCELGKDIQSIVDLPMDIQATSVPMQGPLAAYA